MSKRTVFTTLTPLPAGISRETVLEFLHDHFGMIDLNPLVEERHPIKPPPNATAEEYHCLWYSLTDRVSYLPGGAMSGKVSYNACMHDLVNGLQTHCYAPMGLNIRSKWTLGGTLPGEPVGPVEMGIGAPMHGLYLREDVDMKCNILMTSFVKKTLKKAHLHLVDRLIVKSQITDASIQNQKLEDKMFGSQLSGSRSSTAYSPSEYTRHSSFDSSRTPSFQLAPQRPVSGFHVPGYTENTNESNYPKPLSLRSSSPSFNGSISSYQESGRSQSRERVSWQNLQPNRTPSMHHDEPAPAYQSNNPYRTTAQGTDYYAGEIRPQQNLKPVQSGGRFQSHSSPNLPVELE